MLIIEMYNRLKALEETIDSLITFYEESPNFIQNYNVIFLKLLLSQITSAIAELEDIILTIKKEPINITNGVKLAWLRRSECDSEKIEHVKEWNKRRK